MGEDKKDAGVLSDLAEVIMYDKAIPFVMSSFCDIPIL